MTTAPVRLDAARSALLVVDVQQRLAPHVHRHRQVIEGCVWLLGVAGAVGVPALVSEHYPEGIGPSVPEVAACVAPQAVVRKDHFSCLEEPAVAARIEALERHQWVLAGMEAHVCVLQTGLDLLATGASLFLVADAIGSRRPGDARLARERLRAAGAQVVSREMVLFEWARRGATPLFRGLHRRFLRAPSATEEPEGG
jgi:nicotinamidase-related amidase